MCAIRHSPGLNICADTLGFTPSTSLTNAPSATNTSHALMYSADTLLHTAKSGQRQHLLEPASSAQSIGSAALVVSLVKDVRIAIAHVGILQDAAHLLIPRLAVMFRCQWKMTAMSCI
ncbi:hypothetical protein JI435_421100 [Parastagonospora nodorum SN15]|uniref:Uncharacterized protein n=1 Tax=Phaeosphaeria nodorum (strain SN15 / ATCC MYA-4574 / FGSC 10173) TaxID=321614 RepID=A0A7U2FFQ4_PHANO|nr:hypothetical protein HBI10_117160 [Parastagonospora nodorum]KAH5430934.1 hypothetical protein HBI47_104800 [Parastagonospora nodorum]KAH6041600.1 hypothetical protein HBI54_149030 [Parastagonospora nodorum]KAH6215311.1 hypothetical protein HBI53_096650 [Parastagonospora nodorum]QRD04411.1 hypothetical protein JI435_421100 [Parastagonospora nodorum SN15]